MAMHAASATRSSPEEDIPREAAAKKTETVATKVNADAAAKATVATARSETVAVVVKNDAVVDTATIEAVVVAVKTEMIAVEARTRTTAANEIQAKKETTMPTEGEAGNAGALATAAGSPTAQWNADTPRSGKRHAWQDRDHGQDQRHARGPARQVSETTPRSPLPPPQGKCASRVEMRCSSGQASAEP